MGDDDKKRENSVSQDDALLPGEEQEILSSADKIPSWEDIRMGQRARQTAQPEATTSWVEQEAERQAKQRGNAAEGESQAQDEERNPSKFAFFIQGNGPGSSGRG